MDDDQNKLYTDFSGRNVLTGITADNFDSLRQFGFINPKNKDFFDDLLRIGALSSQISSSGPMPGTAEGISVTATDAGSVVAKKPEDGEVYQLIGASVGVKYTGQTSVILQLRDDASNVSIELSDSTAQGEPFPENAFISPIFITKELFLQCTFVGSGTGGTGDVRIGVIRVR